MKRPLLVLLTLFVLGALALPTFAAPVTPVEQTTRTITLTEADINARLRTAKPFPRTLSNVYVNLQPGQVTITARISVSGGTALDVSGTLVPSVGSRWLTWNVISVTIDGVSATSDQISTYNITADRSWRRYFRSALGPGRITGVEITEDSITFTLTTQR